MSAGGLEQLGLHDLRAALPRNPQGGPGQRLPLAQKRGIVIHYYGPAVAAEQDEPALLQSAARYHISQNWGSGPRHLGGDGLMYHLAIGRSGDLYWCREVEDVLWHCGAWPANAEALAVLVLLGGAQRATSAQLGALERVCETWAALGRGGRAQVWGHQELSPTSCPGTLMSDFVLPYRHGGRLGMAQGHFFPETGHFIGGAFWDYWQTRGGLMLFGYPLTEELNEAGRTVQYFERAVFEWWPENEAPFQVLLRRLGAETLERRRLQHRP